MYKAEDLQYDLYENEWDVDRETAKWTAPPLRQSVSRPSSQSSRTLDQESQTRRDGRCKPKFVAIKKIYVTSSPSRILNEIELLHDLGSCEAVCPLITAFRCSDQVVAILPYFRHANFQGYFRNMSPRDMAIYLRVLFTGLSAVHAKGILHRDVKPTNFLYDPNTQRGVLVDFGLAEREGVDAKPCLCRESRQVRQQRLHAAYANYTPISGYPKNDTRPSRRANRAGTRGFRAPEVLFKCTEQSTKIDVWSAGVILLTILTRRFPFFNSADDVDATIEMATMFGVKRMRMAAQLHGVMFETNIPTIPQGGFALERIVTWSTCRVEATDPLTTDEKLAISFLRECLELDPAKRLSAEAALHHEFLKLGLDESTDSGDDDEMDMLRV